MCDLENYFKFIINTPVERIVISLGIIFIFVIINKHITAKVIKFTVKLVEKTTNKIDDNLIAALNAPIKLLIMFIGVYLSFEYLDKGNLYNCTGQNSKVIKTSIVIVIGLFIYNLTLKDSVLYCKIQEKNTNKILFPFVSIIIRLVIIVICVSIIAKEFGFSGFITGLGISGLAFALAAQDTFSNLFGGIVIVLDKPFAIGDWIQASDIEGIVEDITFRSTRIRTFSKALTTVPNSKLANINIINWTQRGMRRIHFKFTISYDSSPDKIKTVVDKIEHMLENNEKVSDELIIVSFNEFKSYGFGIFIYFYTPIIDYKQYEKVKQEINLNILFILNEYGIRFAYPVLSMNNSEGITLEGIKNITEEERI